MLNGKLTKAIVTCTSVVALACAFTGAAAAAPAILTLDGYPDAMPLDTWGFTVSKATRASSPRFTDFTFTRTMDRNSSRISLNDLPMGKPISWANVYQQDTGSSPQIKYCFSNILFSSYEVTGASSGVPKERISFNYETVTQRYTPPSGPTGVIMMPIRTGWNLLRMVGLSSFNCA